MKIALIGYGKMGKAIEAIALQKNHEVVLKITDQNIDQLTIENLQQCDVAIEFTGADSAVNNIEMCFTANVPVVCGSTGWLSHWDNILKNCKDKNATFLYASNFSIGVNLFFELNKKLAQLMAKHATYKVNIEEIHHTQKKDAPSGTAITLAEQIIAERKEKTDWILGEEKNETQLSILSKRIDPAPGIHSVNYTSAIDDITITHTAHNREGFALGAVLAAEFIVGKKGVFTMQDVLQL
jgi:4-hydroxy-tetrahydrodipicolinate reductase